VSNWFKVVILIPVLFLPISLLSDKNIFSLWDGATAAEFMDGQKILAPDGSIGDNYGASVAISGNTAIVGARHAHGPVPDSGAAYVYKRDADGNWVLYKS